MVAKKRTPAKGRAPARKSRAPSARPPGLATVTPHLAVDGAVKAIEFYKTAFGAREEIRETTPEGRIMHCRLRIGNSAVMLVDRFEDAEMVPPAAIQHPAIALHLYLPDIDTVWSRAVAAGARVVMPLDDMFWGERYGQLRDPFGNLWSISMRIPMSAREKEEKRAAAMRSFAAGEHPGRDK